MMRVPGWSDGMALFVSQASFSETHQWQRYINYEADMAASFRSALPKRKSDKVKEKVKVAIKFEQDAEELLAWLIYDGFSGADGSDLFSASTHIANHLRGKK